MLRYCLLQLRASYSGKTPSIGRRTQASPAPSLARTPAILHEEAEPLLEPQLERQPSRDEVQIRRKALNAFEEASIRKDALRAHGAITDNLLNF